MNFKFAVTALMIPILLAGCASSNVAVRAGDSSTLRGSAPTPGTSYSSAVVHMEVSPNAYLGMLFFGSAMLGLHEDDGRPVGRAFSRRPPDMVEGRDIAERDCSKPLGPVSGNLRCK